MHALRGRVEARTNHGSVARYAPILNHSERVSGFEKRPPSDPVEGFV